MLGGSEKKKCAIHLQDLHDVITLIARILTDTRRSNNIKKIIKFGWKIRIQQRLGKQDS